jgi:hypothetical protein
MTERYPKYFAVNDRPGKLVSTADGGLDVIALDMQTGEWVRDYDFLHAVYGSGRDVDKLTEEEFDALVAKTRAWIKGEDQAP